MHKIDIVYLWVDGSDKKWQTAKNEWLKKIQGIKTIKKNAYGDERYRDNGELKYSLRSVAENIPWINHIYIITDFDQVPKWLNTSHPKITIVPHRDIIPSDARPTFNSNTIEMCIHNITDLSEHFLLMNDDLFVNRPLSPSFFFNHNGEPVTMYGIRHNHKNIDELLKKCENYTATLILSAKLIHEIYDQDLYKYMPTHGIDPYIKSKWIECRNHPLIKPYIDEQIFNKFRTNNELQRWIFSLYNMVNKYGHMRRAYPHKSGHCLPADTLYNITHCRSTRKSPYVCSYIQGHEKSLSQCAIFCINDSEDNSTEMLNANIEYLDARWPNKSEFEK